jgi:two-component system cell cycle sensor histidine kinase/response regulator CckA
MERSGSEGPAAAGPGPPGPGPRSDSPRLPGIAAPPWLSSLRVKILLLVVVATGPALGVVVHAGMERRREALERAGLEAQGSARAAARLQEEVFDEARQFLNAVALFPAVRDLDREDCARLLPRLLREERRTGDLGILDADGEVLAGSAPGVVGGGADRSFFQRALQTKRFAVGRLQGENGGRTVRVGFPLVGQGGAVRGVLFATVDLAVLHAVLHRLDLPQGSVVQVLDDGGRVLARYPDPLHEPGVPGSGAGVFERGMALPDAGSVSVRGPDGVARRFGFAPLRSAGDATGGIVAVGVPERAVVAAAETDLIESTLLVVGAALLALGASWFFGNRLIVDRVDGLLRATRRLSTGEIRARRSARDPGPGELGQLERAFDEMALSLEVRTDELRSAEARYRELVEVMPAVFWSWRPGSGLEYVSPQIGALTGRAPEAWIGGTAKWEERAEPADRDGLAKAVAGALEGRGGYQAEYRVRNAEGATTWVREHGAVDRAGPGGAVRVRGFLVDVSERKTLERQFLQAQKMEALGRLSASVAHDFNNLLTVISGYGQLLQSRFASEPEVKGQLEEIARAAERASVLTRQLLHFSRRREADPQVVDVNDALAALDRMVRRLIGDRIAVETSFAPEPWPVRVDRGHLDQVVMNLVVNARDAMTGRGTLHVRTENCSLDAPAASDLGPAARPGDFVVLTVADTGCGMDEATRARIFEPFFTTKGEGKGTGLGLPTVDEIVRGAGGFIDLRTAPGRGTAFRIHFPRYEGPEAARVAAAESVRGAATPRHVLLVDDDASIRGFALQFLRDEGHTVVEAASAAEARRAAAAATTPFDLLLVDVSLPDADGGDLARELAAAPSRPRVVMMSGFSPAHLREEGRESGGFRFLQKPFRPADLREAIHRVFA